MSANEPKRLADKWAEYSNALQAKYASSHWKPSAFILARIREAFYAGAKAWRDESEAGALTMDMNAEIDHFRKVRAPLSGNEEG